MTDRQENLLNMYRTVIAVCDANLAKFAPTTAFHGMITKLKGNVNAVLAIRYTQEMETKGITEQKEQYRHRLARIAGTIAGAIRAYAIATNKLDLKERVNYSESELLRMRVEELLNAAKIIAEETTVHADEGLDAYGTDGSRYDELMEAIQFFEQAIPGTSVARTSRKTATENLKNLVTATNALLSEQMDQTVKIYQQPHPSFVLQYQAARKVIPSGVRIETEGTVLGTVTLKLTGMPLEGVLIELVGSAFIGSTDAEGMYRLNDVRAGVYTLRATKTGYKTYTAANKAVASRQELTLNVEMELV